MSVEAYVMSFDVRKDGIETEEYDDNQLFDGILDEQEMSNLKDDVHKKIKFDAVH